MYFAPGLLCIYHITGQDCFRVLCMFLTFPRHLSTSLSIYRNFFYAGKLAPCLRQELQTLSQFSLLLALLVVLVACGCFHIYIHLSIYSFMGSGLWGARTPLPLSKSRGDASVMSKKPAPEGARLLRPVVTPRPTGV